MITLIGFWDLLAFFCESFALSNYFTKILFEPGCGGFLQKLSGTFRCCTIVVGRFLLA